MITTLGELIDHSVDQYGDHAALSYVGEEPVSFNEISEKINSIIPFLEKLGIGKGDHVALLSTNQPNWGIAFFALTKMGATVVPVLPDFSVPEIENIINHAEVKAIFVSEGLYRKIEGVHSDFLKTKILIDTFSVIPEGASEKELGGLETSLVKGEMPVKKYTVNPDDVASIIYTSGTTGKSKGVMLTHLNLIFTAERSGLIHKLTSDDRMLSILPLSHTYENTIGFILPVIYGATVYYLRKPPVSTVLLPALKEVRPTLMLSVPLIIEKIYKGKILPEMNSKMITRTLYRFSPSRKLLNRIAGKKLMETFGGKLEFFGIGGAKLDPEVERFMIEARFPYAVGYGLTETSPLLAGFDSYNGKFQSTGPAMKDVTLKINAPDPLTGEGEIWAKGDNVMKGYYKEPVITKEVITEDGWFKTGDLGCFDKSGYLFIKGRLKNMILGASGENIYPEEIEAIINGFKYVLESVVVQKKGKLVAMVHFNMDEVQNKFQNLKEQANLLVEKYVEDLKKELQVYVNSQVNKFSKVQLVIAHPVPFEKTATQKIKRFLYC